MEVIGMGRRNSDHYSIELHQPNFVYKREMSEVAQMGSGNAEDTLEGGQEADGAPDEKVKTDKNGISSDGSSDLEYNSLFGGRRNSRMRQQSVTFTTSSVSCCFIKGLNGFKLIQFALVFTILILIALFIYTSYVRF